MEKQILDSQTMALLLSQFEEVKNARIYQGNTQRPFSVQSLTLNLSTARTAQDPFKVGFPFTSVWMQTATDTSVSVTVQIGTRDTYQSGFTMSKNDAWKCQYPVSEAYLSWSAQSGKSVTFVFFTDAEFLPGSQISVSSGGVTTSTGTAFTMSVTTLAAATAASVFTNNSSRKNGTIQNLTGASIWVGPSTVVSSGALRGMEISPGASFEWKNTAQLYAYSVGGGDVHLTEET